MALIHKPFKSSVMRPFKVFSFLLIGLLSTIVIDSTAASLPTNRPCFDNIELSILSTPVFQAPVLVMTVSTPAMVLLPTVKEEHPFCKLELAAPQLFETRAIRPPDRWITASLPLLYYNTIPTFPVIPQMPCLNRRC